MDGGEEVSLELLQVDFPFIEDTSVVSCSSNESISYEARASYILSIQFCIILSSVAGDVFFVKPQFSL